MRTLTPLSLLLVPAALVAQAPTPKTLTETYNAEVKGITELLNQLKATEAVEKAKAMLPAQAPTIEANKFGEGLENGRAYSMMHHALANALGVAGEWEKGKEVQAKRVAAAKQLQADLAKAILPIEEQWAKVVTNAKDYIAKNEPRKTELEAKLKALREEFDAVNAGKKKLKKEELADLQARGKVAQQEEQELGAITQGLPIEKENIEKEKKVRSLLDTLRKDVQVIVTAAEEGLAKIDKAIAGQNEEIKKFNDEQNEKAKKAAGKKAPKVVYAGADEWVKAVMNGKTSLTEKTKVQDQYALLNRLRVLSPANKEVGIEIENLQAGRELFYKPKKAGKAAAKPAKTK